MLSGVSFAAIASPRPIRDEYAVSESAIKARSKFSLQSDSRNEHLNWRPQLHYRKYLEHQPVSQGTVPEECTQVWQGSVVQVLGGAGLIGWNQVIGAIASPRSEWVLYSRALARCAAGTVTV